MSDKSLPRILCVDDEPNVLDALGRHLRRKFDYVMAPGPVAGLEAFAAHGGFPVVLSDLKMPQMDGLAFLEEIRARSPETVCLLLTGNADLQSAITAVNDGTVFRFLTKPCPPDTLLTVLETAVAQHRLKSAERDVLERTLSASVRLLTDILALVSPLAFSRANRVKEYVTHIVRGLALTNSWEVQLAAMLSQIGCVTLPAELLDKVHAGEELTDEEAAMYGGHHEVAARLLVNVPRLERVAAIVGAQGDDTPPQEPEIALNAGILRVACVFDRLTERGAAPKGALAQLRKEPHLYDPSVVAALRDVQALQEESIVRMVTVPEMNAYMTLEQDVVANNGTTVVRKGLDLSVPTIERLRRFAQGVGIVEPIRVRVRRSRTYTD